MLAGQLRHRVTFQTPSTATDDYGDPAPVWSALDTVWARVEPITGKERFAALQVQADVNHRILCRYNSTIASLAPDDRVVFGSLTFDIKAVINTDERNIELQVFAKQHI